MPFGTAMARLKTALEELETNARADLRSKGSITAQDRRALRSEIYAAYATRASDQGPHAGQFDNTPRIEKIMALRHEAAHLVGFANAAEESLATKMAPSADKVMAFLHDLAVRAKPVAIRERDELAAFARDSLGLATLEPWDTAYAGEKLRQGFVYAEQALVHASLR